MTSAHRTSWQPNPLKLLFPAFALLCFSLAGCPGGNPVVTLPAAQTPVLETILVEEPSISRVAMFHTSGDWGVLPYLRLQLRLRAPWPSHWTIGVNGIPLPQVKDAADHPELYTTGWYHIDSENAIDITDPAYFWKIFVRLPQPLQFSSKPFQIEVLNISEDPSLPGAAPLVINIRAYDPLSDEGSGTVEPSSVFFSGDNSLPTSEQIACCVTLAGWLEPSQPELNTPGTGYPDCSHCAEDYHYAMLLDDDFIRRNYTSVADLPLADRAIPGTCEQDVGCSRQPIPLLYGLPNADTFLLPGEGDDMTVELNSWHIPERDEPPVGWLHPDPSNTDLTNDAWPFNPMRPFPLRSGDAPLQPNDYVIVSGYLIEDKAHLKGPSPAPNSSDYPIWQTRQCFNRTFAGQGGWLEIHPVDSVRTVRAYPGQAGPPLIRKNTNVVDVCSNGGYGIPSSDMYLYPWPTPSPASSAGNPARYNLEYEEDIDPRLTDMSTVTNHTVRPCYLKAYGPALHVTVAVGDKGHFKATYLLWWEIVEGDQTPAPLPYCVRY